MLERPEAREGEDNRITGEKITLLQIDRSDAIRSLDIVSLNCLVSNITNTLYLFILGRVHFYRQTIFTA